MIASRSTLVGLILFATGLVLTVTSPWGPCGPASLAGFVGVALVAVSVFPLLKAIVTHWP